jgi:hypothetical protein
MPTVHANDSSLLIVSLIGGLLPCSRASIFASSGALAVVGRSFPEGGAAQPREVRASARFPFGDVDTH